MRNLKIVSSQHFQHTRMELNRNIVNHMHNRSLFFVNGNKSVKLCNNKSGDVKEIYSGGEIVAMEFLQLNESLCVATSEGEIVVIDLNTDNYNTETVGLIADGIEEMCWSPDQELVVFVSR